MWKSTELGLAVCGSEGSTWFLDARGGAAGIGINAGADASASGDRFFALSSVDQDHLPVAAEQYVRGDQWHIVYPQAGGLYALKLVFRPILCDADRIVLETTVSIQTDLLDTHPKVDIDCDALDIDSVTPSTMIDEKSEALVLGSGSAPISIAKQKSAQVAVMLGPHDSPFTTNHSTDTQLRLRLFGDFLEKGVIRKARPWIAIDRSGTAIAHDWVRGLWKQLCDSPLPLTA